MTGRRVAVALLLLSTAASPIVAPLAAQKAAASRGREHRIPRRLLFAAIGVGIGGALAASYSAGKSTPGACSSSSCVTLVSIGSGAFVGYLIGREFDQIHAIRYRVGVPLEPEAVSASLALAPTAMAAGDSGVAVAGPGGVDVFAGARGKTLGTPTRRANGIRGITSLSIVTPTGVLAVTSPTGVFLYPPRTGPGALLRDGASSASARVAGGRVAFAVGTRVEVAPAQAVDSAQHWPGIELGRSVQTMTYDSAHAVLWVGADSTLVALRAAGDSLERVGSTPLAAGIRSIAVLGGRLAVALGESGVRVFDVRNPAAPTEQSRWTSARFVYDVSLSPDRLFVAAGGEGVYVLRANPSPNPVIGLARDLGFIIGVETRGPDTYLLDRDGPTLHRIATRF